MRTKSARVDSDYVVFDRDQLTDSELQGYEAGGVNASLIFVDSQPGEGRVCTSILTTRSSSSWRDGRLSPSQNVAWPSDHRRSCFFDASGIGRLDPRQMLQPRPKGFVRRDQVDAGGLGDRHVDHVVDRVIVKSPRQLPGAVDMARVVCELQG